MEIHAYSPAWPTVPIVGQSQTSIPGQSRTNEEHAMRGGLQLFRIPQRRTVYAGGLEMMAGS